MKQNIRVWTVYLHLGSVWLSQYSDDNTETTDVKSPKTTAVFRGLEYVSHSFAYVAHF